MRKSTSLLTITLVFLAVIAAAFFSNQYPTYAEDDHGDYRFSSTQLDIGSGAITGAIDSANILFDIDYFFFPAVRGVRYTFVLDEVTVVNARIAVVNSLSRGNSNSPGQELTVAGGKKTVTWTSRTTDTYYVEVSGSINNFDGSFNLGDYTLSGFEDTRFLDRHSDLRNGATQISPGNVYQGAISPWTNQPNLASTVNGGDDYDYFSFQAQRGVQYDVEVELGTSEGVEIAIHSAFAGVKKSNDGIGDTLSWISPSNSTYYVAVSGTDRVRDPRGTYALKLSAETSLLDRHADAVASATVIRFGNANQGSISPADDLDYFSFQALRGAEYTLEASLGNAAGVELSVVDTDGTTLVSNGGVGTTLGWRSTGNGTFLAVVSASPQVPSVIGTYSLNLSDDTFLQDRHGETPATATALTLGFPQPGAISPESDRDYFSFSAERGANYSVALELGSADGAVISIEDAAGKQISSTNGLGTGLGWTAASTGIFYVVVSESTQAAQSIGSYSLTMEANTSLEDRHLDTASSGTQLSFGTVYQGAISPKSDLDYFSFVAERGVEYTLDLTYGSATAVSLEVNTLGGGSDTVARNFGQDNIVLWTAPDSATYYVKVSASPQAEEPTGTYTFKVTPDTTLRDRHGDLAGNATVIGFGNAIAGAISPSDDYDYFKFTADEGITYFIDVTLGSADGVRFSVENQSAGYSASNFGLGETLEWEAPATRWYTLAVSASGRVDNPIGTYHITITREGDARPPLPNVVEPTQEGSGEATPRVISPDATALILESRVSPTGSTLRLPVKLQRIEGVSSLGFTLNYDPDSLRVTAVERGSRLTEESFSYNTDTAGQVRFGVAVTKGTGSGGTAAVVEFQVIAADGSLSPLTISDALMIHSTGGELTVELVSAEFKVGAKIQGDGNGDGLVTALDALLALKMASNLLVPELSLDINHDGKITIEDARRILILARPS